MQEVDIKSLKTWRTYWDDFWPILLMPTEHIFQHMGRSYKSCMPMLQLWYYINCISQTWIYLPRVSTFLFIKKMKSILFWQWY